MRTGGAPLRPPGLIQVPDRPSAVRQDRTVADTPQAPPLLTAAYQAVAGHRADGFPAVSQLLLRQLSDGFPAAVSAAVCTPAASAYTAAGGWARLAALPGDDPVPATAATLFDLASLTKVIATVPLVLLLQQRRRWSIDDPVGRWLPGAPPSPVTISDSCCMSAAWFRTGRFMPPAVARRRSGRR